jgi:hypothetical protein
MPKGIPEQPWPLSKSELEQQATAALAKLLQAYPERSGDLGNPSNLSKFILAYEFYRDQGFPQAEIGSHLKGIDFNNPVEIVTMPPPKLLSQWQIPALGTEAPRVGCYWMIPRASTPRSLGINPEGPRFAPDKGRPSSSVMMTRTQFNFKCSDDTPQMPVLRSSAAPIIDDWTDKRNPRNVYGGGIQHFSRELGDYYKPTDTYQLGKQWLRASKWEVFREEEEKQNVSPEFTMSKSAMQTVLENLNLAQLTILSFRKNSDTQPVIAQLITLVEDAEKAVNEANKAATALKTSIEQQADEAPIGQKYEAAQALHYADIAKKNFKEISQLFIDFKKTSIKANEPSPRLHEPFLDLKGKQKYAPLPSITPAQQKTMSKSGSSLQSLDKQKKHVTLPPIPSGDSINKHHKFKDAIHGERTKKEEKEPPNKTDTHKPN